MDEGPGSLREA